MSTSPEDQFLEKGSLKVVDEHPPSIIDEPIPHLHAKTFLTVFAVCLIYFAQLVNVVGAGAVSTTLLPVDEILIIPACSRYLYCSRRILQERLAYFDDCYPHSRLEPTCLPSSRLLGPTMVSHWTHSMRSYRIYHRCSS